jgi:hypothetical protein
MAKNAAIKFIENGLVRSENLICKSGRSKGSKIIKARLKKLNKAVPQAGNTMILKSNPRTSIIMETSISEIERWFKILFRTAIGTITVVMVAATT